MIEYPLIMWSLLAAAFIIVLILNILENRKLKSDLQKKYSLDIADNVSRFHWSRSIQLLTIIGFSFVLIALYDWQVREIKDRLESTNSPEEMPVASSDNINNDVNNDDIDTQKNYYPPLIVNTTPADTATKNSIQDIFDIEKDATGSISTINDVKTRYEDLLVTYFILQKCGKTKESDYNLIIASLQKEIAALQAPIRFQYDTITAAKGSYDELYSNNDCEKSDLEATENQYNSYIATLSNQQKH